MAIPGDEVGAGLGLAGRDAELDRAAGVVDDELDLVESSGAGRLHRVWRVRSAHILRCRELEIDASGPLTCEQIL